MRAHKETDTIAQSHHISKSVESPTITISSSPNNNIPKASTTTTQSVDINIPEAPTNFEHTHTVQAPSTKTTQPSSSVAMLSTIATAANDCTNYYVTEPPEPDSSELGSIHFPITTNPFIDVTLASALSRFGFCGGSVGLSSFDDFLEMRHELSVVRSTGSWIFDVEYNGSKYEHQVLDDSKRNPEVSLDDDGDLALPRRSKRSKNNFVVAIQHNITSSIPKVGLQVWRAELVLSDFVLHKMFTSSEFDGIVALELGAGTGLVGMLLARVAKTVYLTDHGVEILENCASNVHLNSALLPSKASVNVRELDWKASWPPQQSIYPSRHSYAWNLSELEELERASLLVAADVIYSDDLTNALFTTLERLMSCGIEKVLYLALEKRYNFSVDDLDVVANGYSRFRSYVRDENEHDKIPNGSSCVFIGTRLDLTKIPQYANDHIRGQDVELWQIKYAREEENL